MSVRVRAVDGGCRIDGDWDGLEAANAFLAHLAGRGFSPATVRAYAFDVLNLARFLTERDLALSAVDAPLVFDWIDWQGVRRPGRAGAADRGRSGSAAASTVNRRVAAVRALFEYLVMTGQRADNPVPSPRRGQGLRRSERGLLGHLGPGRARAGGRLVRQPQLLPESLPATDIDAFLATLATNRDRAMMLAMLLGGSAVGGGAGPAAGGCGHGPAAAAGDRQGRQGTPRAGRCGVLHRGGGLSAVGAPTGAGDTAVLCGAARPDHRRADRRGRAAQPIPPPPGTLRRDPGASAPAAPHLRHRISLGGNRSADIARVDGACLPGNHGPLRAPVGRAARRRIRRRPGDAGGSTTMTAAVLQGLVVDADALLGDYLDHVAGLGLSGRAVRDRTRIAREFLSRHPDLDAWMDLPAAARAADLRSTGAWPLLCYAIGTGRVRLDVELAAVKQLTGLGGAVQARDLSGFAMLREAGNRLGWSSSWVETVLGECLAVLLAWHGGLVADLTTDVIDEFDTALSRGAIPRSSRRAYRARLASLRQLLYETRVVDTAPSRRR